MLQAEFTALIFLFTAYYFIERCLRLILIAYNTPFYQKLQAARKDLVFFGIWMGLLITTISTPFCVLGARDEWNILKQLPADFSKGNPTLGHNAKVCIAARSILWVSELNRLDLYGLYVVHHAGSIISLLSFLYFEWPAVIFLTIYSTLISEIPGDLVWMVSSYIEAIDNCSPAFAQFKSRLVAFNVAQYALFRGVGLAVVYWTLWTTGNAPLHGHSVLEQTYGHMCIGLYALFCGHYIVGQYNKIPNHTHTPSHESLLKSASLPTQLPAGLTQERSRAIRVQISTTPPVIIVPYGLFMGIGFAALVLVSLTVGAPSHGGLEDVSFALNLTLVSAVFCARLMSVIMEDGISALFLRPLHSLLRPGFWLHGGLFGAAAGALLAYKLGHVKDFSVFAGSLAVGLPLYETFSRIGCHTYGCCYGRVVVDDHAHSETLWWLFPYSPVRYSHLTDYAATRINPKLLHQPLIPIQLISATLFLLLFLGVALPLSHYTSVEVAGATTLICHAIVRLITETYRADFRGREDQRLSVTGKMALVQAQGALVWLVCSLAVYKKMSPSWLEQFEPSNSLNKDLLGLLFPVTLGIVVYGIHIGEIGSWVSKVDRQTSRPNSKTSADNVH